tara:strand:+ start:5644 stop:6459 length:816 start_codon:yes stop_codon:yes gene_type:complete
MLRTKNSDIAARNVFFTETINVVTGVTTSIDIIANGIEMFKDGDTILLLDKVGYIYPLTVDGDVASTDTIINIVSYDFGLEQILPGSLVSYYSVDLFQQYQRKTKGKIAGMPVSADTLGPIQYTGGRYIANFDSSRGEDLDYIIVLPSDFMINDDVASPAQFKDSTTTGLQVSNTSSEVLAFIRIATGKKATKVDIFGTNPKVVQVYEMNVDANTNLTTATDLAGGTGVMNTQITLTSEVASTATNYLLILVKLTSTSNRIWGGKVTIDNI